MFGDNSNKTKIAVGAAVSLFLAFAFLMGGLVIIGLLFGVASGICFYIINKIEKAEKSAAPIQNQQTNHRSKKKSLIGGVDYITSKGITPDMIYGMKTKCSNNNGVVSVYFPKTFNNLSFARKFDSVKVCVITNARPDYRKIKNGETVILLPEPTNVHDKKAIMIISQTQKLGYIYRNGMQDILNEKFRAGNIVVGAVTEIDAKTDYIKIDIVAYK